jgi:hypothetical protein
MIDLLLTYTPRTCRREPVKVVEITKEIGECYEQVGIDVNHIHYLLELSPWNKALQFLTSDTAQSCCAEVHSSLHGNRNSEVEVKLQNAGERLLVPGDKQDKNNLEGKISAVTNLKPLPLSKFNILI